MRGGFWSLVVLVLFLLSGCNGLEIEKQNYWSVADFNKVSIIDYPYEDLDANEVQSIYETYQNEIKALALYRKTLDLFEGEQPFESIMLQQEIQMGLFEEVYDKYELQLPEENWYDKVTDFEDLAQACTASILFAQQSIDFYDAWLDNKGVSYKVDNQDLRFLYEKTRNNYETVFIPMFKRCGRGIN
ncbi:MAG: hypothetical protein KC535_03625 [Nanoarchaeota archaeon]|nr:hypothetical protein [Nanoarchaeota archaeon]